MYNIKFSIKIYVHMFTLEWNILEPDYKFKGLLLRQTYFLVVTCCVKIELIFNSIKLEDNTFSLWVKTKGMTPFHLCVNELSRPL